jgi:hypothetical protein
MQVMRSGELQIQASSSISLAKDAPSGLHIEPDRPMMSIAVIWLKWGLNRPLLAAAKALD